MRAYLLGGRPAGAARPTPGCRDPRPPERSIPLELPGRLHFATRSPVWSGGRAFWDPDAGGTTWARAYLITLGQFSDIAAQEMYRTPGPGTDLDPAGALADGRAALGPGRYETLVCPGFVGGLPVLTFTAPWRCGEVPGVCPSAAYLRHLAAGLLDAGAWEASTVARYLAAAPGAEGWTPERVAELMPGAAKPAPGTA
ncbi:histone deacetylase [Streptomyces sp. SID5473]|uniref:Histone deacetylase n=1 Tax=Streptomyces tsukubensis (strain DSM 42081 / NBRC 108919 / NRRL 18488 / 9993) TaxID=1114943 RepID=A0A7G3US66_STRT9|nr:histone deacetylase [Streptomyces sp. SID5473]QKM71885.1 histone deacetylase [Streptomyces tsukubensis NRRL18488]TAI46521.1 histone deacetylase [Streptomyces tsukubensis]